MKTQTTRQTVEVRADGEGLLSHAGAFLLVELADRLELTAALSEAMAPTRERRSAHDPGVVLRDLAVSVADGGDCLSDLGPARAGGLFGLVGAKSTAHRAIKSIDAVALEAIRAANTAADHFEVLQLALEQLPPEDLHREIRARVDIGGRTHAFAQDCRDAGIRFSVGYEVDAWVREAIGALPQSAWQQAIDAEGKSALAPKSQS